MPSLDYQEGKYPLRIGMFNNPAVAELQKRLGIHIDGDFGPKTRAALLAFQRRAIADGLLPKGSDDGIFNAADNKALSMVEAHAATHACGACLPSHTQERQIKPSDIIPPGRLLAIAHDIGIKPETLRQSLQHSANEINTLHPDMRAAVALGMRKAFEHGIPVIAYEGYRNGHAQERARKGDHSSAGAGDSYHNYGCGIDVQIMTDKGQPDWDRENPVKEKWRHQMQYMWRHDFGMGILSFSKDPGHVQLRQGGISHFRNAHGLHRGFRPPENDTDYFPLSSSWVPAGVQQANTDLQEHRRPRLRLTVANAGHNGELPPRPPTVGPMRLGVMGIMVT